MHRCPAVHPCQSPIHRAPDSPARLRTAGRRCRSTARAALGRNLAAARVLQRWSVPLPPQPVEGVHAPSRHDPAMDQSMVALLRTVADYRALVGHRPRLPGHWWNRAGRKQVCVL